LLSILGRSGNGKSTAAARLVKNLHDRYGYGPSEMVFLHVPSFCRDLMNPERREAAFERAVGVRFAVCDDLGASYIKSDSFLEAMLEDLIVVRESERRPTLCIANWTARQLEDALGFRIADRLVGGLVEEIHDPSFRRQQAGRRG